MLKEETTLKKENLFPFLFLVGMIVVLPLSISKEAPFSTQYFRFQVCIIALFVYAMTIMIKNFLKRIREHKSITQTIQ